MVLKIHLQQIKTSAVIGVHHYEQTQKQPLILDLTLVLKVNPSSLDDQLEQSVDYSKVYRQVLQWLDETKFKLLESLASFLATKLLDHFALKSVWVRIYKPHALKDLADVSVEYFKES